MCQMICALRRALESIARQKNPKNCSKTLGYHYIRSSYQMLIEMDGPCPEPESGPKASRSAPTTLRQMRKLSIALEIEFLP